MTALMEPSAPVRTMTATMWPRLGRCPSCREQVLRVRHRGAGRPITLQPTEIFPEGSCGRCRGTGRVTVVVHAGTSGGQRASARRTSVEPGDMVGRTSKATGEACPACHGTGIRGEPVPADAVVVDLLTGRVARSWGTWQAAFRRHQCGEGTA